VKRIPIISKEEFLICYKTWVDAERGDKEWRTILRLI
jgi:hypothetical protein